MKDGLGFLKYISKGNILNKYTLCYQVIYPGQCVSWQEPNVIIWLCYKGKVDSFTNLLFFFFNNKIDLLSEQFKYLYQ